MPKVHIEAVPERSGVGYPGPFAALSAHRLRRKLGDAGGLTDFGVNITRLPPGQWSSQRHWHSHEDEFVLLLEGELVLVEDDGATVLRAGGAAAFPKGSGNGHHMINRSEKDAVYLEIGSRQPEDVAVCSDVDMMSSKAGGRFVQGRHPLRRKVGPAWRRKLRRGWLTEPHNRDRVESKNLVHLGARAFA